MNNNSPRPARFKTTSEVSSVSAEIRASRGVAHEVALKIEMKNRRRRERPRRGGKIVHLESESCSYFQRRLCLPARLNIHLLILFYFYATPFYQISFSHFSQRDRKKIHIPLRFYMVLTHDLMSYSSFHEKPSIHSESNPSSSLESRYTSNANLKSHVKREISSNNRPHHKPPPLSNR